MTKVIAATEGASYDSYKDRAVTREATTLEQRTDGATAVRTLISLADQLRSKLTARLGHVDRIGGS